MKLIVDRNQLNMNPEQFLRKSGYGYIRDRRRDQESFVRRLGGGFYPRLHMYTETHGDKVIFNLHLDQKQPSYGGSHMHNAEYEGEVVENEIKRLKGLVTAPQFSPYQGREEKGENIIDNIGGNREYDKNAKPPEKKSWWKKLFNF